MHDSATQEELLENDLDEAGEARLYRSMRRFWHPVMRESEVNDSPRRAVLLGEQLVLARLGDSICCFPDLCVHRGTALSIGSIEGDQLRCAYHGWTYGPDGVCTAIPARFGPNIPQRARLHSYPVEERYGLIWVCLENEPAFPIPRFPEVEDRAFKVIPGYVYDWRSSAHRRMENFIDFAHFAWVHDGVLGTRDHPEVADHDVWREGPELRFARRVKEPIAGFTKLDTETADGWVDVDYTYFLTMPLTVHFTRTTLPGGDTYVLMMSASPVGPKEARSFWFLARNYALDEDDVAFLDFERLVQGQDQPVVESQRPEMLPFDLSAELHIRGVDKVSLEYRRWLVDLANAER